MNMKQHHFQSDESCHFPLLCKGNTTSAHPAAISQCQEWRPKSPCAVLISVTGSLRNQPSSSPPSGALAPSYSKCSQGSAGIGISWELVRNAEPQEYPITASKAVSILYITERKGRLQTLRQSSVLHLSQQL